MQKIDHGFLDIVWNFLKVKADNSRKFKKKLKKNQAITLRSTRLHQLVIVVNDKTITQDKICNLYCNTSYSLHQCVKIN